MLVKLRYNWFAPSEKEEYAKGLNLSVSGKRYKAGIHEMPEYLREHLPKDAEIINEEEAKKEKEKSIAKANEEVDLKSLDFTRAAMDQVEEAAEKAEKTRRSYVKKNQA